MVEVNLSKLCSGNSSYHLAAMAEPESVWGERNHSDKDQERDNERLSFGGGWDCDFSDPLERIECIFEGMIEKLVGISTSRLKRDTFWWPRSTVSRKQIEPLHQGTVVDSRGNVALVQVLSQACIASQLSINTQRREELAIKQSMQLILVTPSMPNDSVLNLEDISKVKPILRTSEVNVVVKNG
ncbi:hypothetical protein V6N13_109721 [Hibiscus sabdariffa]